MEEDEIEQEANGAILTLHCRNCISFYNNRAKIASQVLQYATKPFPPGKEEHRHSHKATTLRKDFLC